MLSIANKISLMVEPFPRALFFKKKSASAQKKYFEYNMFFQGITFTCRLDGSLKLRHRTSVEKSLLICAFLMANAN